MTSHTFSALGVRIALTLSRYRTASILSSLRCPFRITWYHRSRDHLTRHWPFPVGGPLEQSIYLQPLSSTSPNLELSQTHTELLFRMRDITCYVLLCKIWVFAYKFHLATMQNMGCSFSGPLMLKAKSIENVRKFSKLWNFRGLAGDHGDEKRWFLQETAHSRVDPSCLSHFAWRSVGICRPVARGVRLVRSNPPQPPAVHVYM